MSKMSESKDRSPCFKLQQASLDCLTDLKRLSDAASPATVCDEKVRLYKRCLKEEMQKKTQKRNDAFFGREPRDTK